MHKSIQLKMVVRLILLLLTCLVAAGVVATVFESWISGIISFILLILLFNKFFLIKKRKLMLGWVEDLLDRTTELHGVTAYDSNHKGKWEFGSLVFQKKQQAVQVQYTKQGIEIFFSGLPKLGVRLLEWHIISNMVIIEIEDLSSSSSTVEIYFNDIEDCCYLPWVSKYKKFIPESVGLNINN